MELRIKDRLYFARILPEHNSYMDYVLKRSVLNKVGITAEDRERYGISQDPETKAVVWNAEKDMAEPVAVEFTAAELEYVRRGCEAFNDKPMPDDFWAVVERIYSAS